MDDDTDTDERHMELETLEAIYPEIQKLSDDDNILSFSIELPVHPANPVTVTFPAASNAAAPVAAVPEDPREPQIQQQQQQQVDSQQLAYLPALVVRISLPDGYPTENPPSFSISTTPPWVPPETASKLEEEGPRMWEDMGRNLVAFNYIDHVQQTADRVFDMIDGDGTLKVDPLHKIAILDYDIKARRAAFERETFDCGVCIEPKKGSVCHQMLDCGHVFCVSCLQDFYSTAITEGDLSTVRCLTPNCARDRDAALAGDPGGGSAKKRKNKTFVSPSELLQIGLSQDTVRRYVALKYKTELESDKNTIYCPRSWCEGAARSKKHRKPKGLELGAPSEEEDEESGEDHDVELVVEGDPEDDGNNNPPQRSAKKKKKKKKKQQTAYDAGDLLAICEDCGFAFCSRCYQSWHGLFLLCAPRRDKGEITVEEQASIDYLKLHTSPCPTCAAPAQKTHGCNHMICFRCGSHFCYLCSAWLDPSNPYQHFNMQPGGKVTSCYMRLWELEGGDGNNVDYDFAGGAPRQQAAVAVAPVDVIDVVPEIEEPDDNDSSDDEGGGGAGGRRDGAPRREGNPDAVAREGPLVLRIGGDPVPRGAEEGAGRHVVPPAAPQAPVRGGRGGARGRGNRGGRGGGGGRQNGLPQPQQNRRRGNNLPQRVPVAGNGRVDGGELDPQQEAWIRNFVQMALMDEEDSDEEFAGR